MVRSNILKRTVISNKKQLRSADLYTCDYPTRVKQKQIIYCYHGHLSLILCTTDTHQLFPR